MKTAFIAMGLSIGMLAPMFHSAASDPPQAPDPGEPSETVEGDGARKLFPYLRINAQERWLEFDGIVPIDVNDPDAPLVYLEQFVCGRESPEIAAGKEHESLVATNAKGSHIHAGLLLLGLEPGTPVKWETEEDGSIRSIDPTGPVVRVEFLWTDATGEFKTAVPQDWVRHAETKERFPEGHWVFSGSMFVNYGAGEVYDADRSGTLIGLTSFGGEVLSWNAAIHHDSGVATPVWSANNEAVPPFGTEVKIRLYTATEKRNQPGEAAPAKDSPEQSNPGDHSEGSSESSPSSER